MSTDINIKEYRASKFLYEYSSKRKLLRLKFEGK